LRRQHSPHDAVTVRGLADQLALGPYATVAHDSGAVMARLVVAQDARVKAGARRHGDRGLPAVVFVHGGATRHARGFLLCNLPGATHDSDRRHVG